jgi:hypothetical protein
VRAHQEVPLVHEDHVHDELTPVIGRIGAGAVGDSELLVDVVVALVRHAQHSVASHDVEAAAHHSVCAAKVMEILAFGEPPLELREVEIRRHAVDLGAGRGGHLDTSSANWSGRSRTWIFPDMRSGRNSSRAEASRRFSRASCAAWSAILTTILLKSRASSSPGQGIGTALSWDQFVRGIRVPSEAAVARATAGSDAAHAKT